MTSHCRTCKQEMNEDNRTLVGKPFKACSRCRYNWRTYCYTRLENCFVKQQRTAEQQERYKEYQLKYRNLMKCPCKNFRTRAISENDFTITFN